MSQPRFLLIRSTQYRTNPGCRDISPWGETPQYLAWPHLTQCQLLCISISVDLVACSPFFVPLLVSLGAYHSCVCYGLTVAYPVLHLLTVSTSASLFPGMMKSCTFLAPSRDTKPSGIEPRSLLCDRNRIFRDVIFPIPRGIRPFPGKKQDIDEKPQG